MGKRLVDVAQLEHARTAIVGECLDLNLRCTERLLIFRERSVDIFEQVGAVPRDDFEARPDGGVHIGMMKLVEQLQHVIDLQIVDYRLIVVDEDSCGALDLVSRKVVAGCFKILAALCKVVADLAVPVGAFGWGEARQQVLGDFRMEQQIAAALVGDNPVGGDQLVDGGLDVCDVALGGQLMQHAGRHVVLECGKNAQDKLLFGRKKSVAIRNRAMSTTRQIAWRVELLYQDARNRFHRRATDLIKRLPRQSPCAPPIPPRACAQSKSR